MELVHTRQRVRCKKIRLVIYLLIIASASVLERAPKKNKRFKTQKTGLTGRHRQGPGHIASTHQNCDLDKQ